MHQLKKTARDVEVEAKETWRHIDGDDSVADKVGNAGDELRKDAGNLGDDLTADTSTTTPDERAERPV